MKSLILTTVAFLIAILAGASAAYISVSIIPCSWYGSGFEGACGYGVMGAAICIGILVGFIVFGLLIVHIFRKKLVSTTSGQVPKFLYIAWFCSLGCRYLVDPIIEIGKFGDLVNIIGHYFPIAAFMVISAVLASRLGKNPLISLVGAISWFGPLIVALFLLGPAIRVASGDDVSSPRK